MRPRPATWRPRTLAAPYGGVHVPIPEQKIGETPCSLDCYLRSIASLDPDPIRWTDRIKTDDRSRLTNAFLIRTRTGGWAACILDERGETGGWAERLATVRYVYNPADPRFVDAATPLAPAATAEFGGVRFDLTAFLTDPVTEARRAEYERRLDLLRQELGALDDLASRYARNPGVAASPEEGVAAVLSRRRGTEILAGFDEKLGLRESHDYVAATYSFEHATRDDEARTHNDWDLLVRESGREQLVFDVNMATDDRSRIWRMGSVPFDALGTQVVPEPQPVGDEARRQGCRPRVVTRGSCR